MRLATILLLGAITGAAAYFPSQAPHADTPDYKSVEECILERMKGVTSDVAAKAILYACRKLTLSNSAPAAPPKKECKNLLSAYIPETGDKIRYSFDFFSVPIYNPSPTVTVTEVVLEIGLITDDGRTVKREFSSSMFLRPLSTERFEVQTGVDSRLLKTVTWKLTRAYGCNYSEEQ